MGIVTPPVRTKGLYLVGSGVLIRFGPDLPHAYM